MRAPTFYFPTLNEWYRNSCSTDCDAWNKMKLKYYGRTVNNRHIGSAQPQDWPIGRRSQFLLFLRGGGVGNGLQQR
jgi:hypothetical protein